EVRERGEAEARRAAGEEAPGQGPSVDDGGSEAAAGDQLGLAVEKGEVEAGVVRDKHGVLGEVEEALDGGERRGRAADVGVADTGQPRDNGADRTAGVDER